MDGFAYVAALLSVMVVPPALLAWLWVHPFVGFWRRLGPRATYTILAIYWVAAMVGIYLVREPLLRVHYGWNPYLGWPGAVVLALSFVLRVRVRRFLTVATMFGLPEISSRAPSRLLTEGIYGKIRHPRYVELGLGLAGLALLTNFLAMYVLVVLYIPLALVIVALEESELKERFGAEYDAYCRKVPRFFPRLRSRG